MEEYREYLLDLGTKMNQASESVCKHISTNSFVPNVCVHNKLTTIKEMIEAGAVLVNNDTRLPHVFKIKLEQEVKEGIAMLKELELAFLN